MTKEEIAKMYIDWTTGADETIKQSDYMRACFDEGYSVEEIEKLGNEILEKRSKRY